MSYPYQPPQGYGAPAQQPPAQYGPPQNFSQQAYADPNAGQQYPPQAPAQNPQFQSPPMAPQSYGAPAQQHGMPQQGYPQNQFPPHQAPYAPEQPEPADVEDTSSMFGGAPSISWDVAKGYVLGTPRGGQIIAKKITQQTNAETKQPRFYEGSGKPMMQIVVTLQTRERTDATDDGKRAIYVKGEMMKSARKAFEEKGAKDLEIGGWFYAANTAKNGGRNGKANVFECAYARPGEPDPLGHLPAYVAPQLAAPAPPAPNQFTPPQQPNYPAPGQPPAWSPYGQPQQAAAPHPQGNQYGYGHQPPQSPGGQAYDQAAQMAAHGQHPTQQSYAPQPPAQDPNQGQQFVPQQSAPAGPPAGYNPFGG